MNKGKIVQVMGPVVDVAFENGALPHIQDALVTYNEGKRCVMEVAQHIGGDVVRCVMLASSEGLYKDMEVEATGRGICVPVGEKHWDGSLMFWVKQLTRRKSGKRGKVGYSQRSAIL